MARKKFSVREVFEKESKKVGTSEGRNIGTSAGRKVRISEGKKVGKDKKSFSIEKGVVEDLEVLAWYTERSASEVVEEALRQYIASNKELLEKAREVREAR